MSEWLVHGQVDHIIDGDTLVVDLDLGWRVWLEGARVRLARINAHELHLPGGAEAKAFLASIAAAGASFTLESKALDKYGRVLGDLTIDGQTSSLSAQMLAGGHAVPMKG